MLERSQESGCRSKWLIISHAFNMDGRAASLTITDKIIFFAKEVLYDQRA